MRPRHDSRRSFRPLLEALEARALLSVCTVDRLGDLDEGEGGRGSLRYCVVESLFRADTINFEVKGVINLTRALPNLTRSVSIEGPGADVLTVRRNTGGEYRIFTVAAGATVAISGLTANNGYEAGIANDGTLTINYSKVSSGNTGRGIFNNGLLTINYCSISENTGGFAGGGIYNSGTLTLNSSTVSGNNHIGIVNNRTLTINNSTISGNSTSGFVGGGGGIDNSGSLTVNNTTISGNSTRNSGGGGIQNYGTLAITNSTITGNTSNSNGGGINIIGLGTMSARNTVIAGNIANLGTDVLGNLGSRGHNLIGNPQDMSGWVETDLLHVNPRLGPLQENGGPTLTHALLPGSPAIDAGDNTDAPAFDQRGRPRVTGNVIDIGAYEVQPGPAAFFYLAAPERAVAGVPFDLFVIAFDADGYVATTYTGTVSFYSATDPDAVLPEVYTFTAASAGVAYLPESAVLYALGTQEVWVYDVETFAAGLASVEVLPGNGPGPLWGHWPDAAALFALLPSEPARARP